MAVPNSDVVFETRCNMKIVVMHHTRTEEHDKLTYADICRYRRSHPRGRKNDLRAYRRNNTIFIVATPVLHTFTSLLFRSIISNMFRIKTNPLYSALDVQVINRV